MITRTRAELISAIDRAQSSASTSSSTSTTSPIDPTSATSISNAPLQLARDNNFCIIPKRDEKPIDEVSFQLDALLRDVIEGGVTYPDKEKLGFPVESAHELKEEFTDYEEFVAYALKKRFGDNWGMVLLKHSQLPAYIMPSIIKNAIHNYGMKATISIDLPNDDEISTTVNKTLFDPDSNDKQAICQFVTRIEKMRITDNNTKETIGYIDGPITTVHSLKEMQEVINGVNATVWRYQLDSIHTPNQQIIDMFEGKMFSQMDLPSYANLINDKHSQLIDICDNYLDKLLHQIGVQLAYKYSTDLNATSYATLTHPEMQPFFEKFPELVAAAKWCETHSKTGKMPEKLANALIEFAALFRDDQAGNQELKALIEKFAANPERLVAIAKHAGFLLQLKAALTDPSQPLNLRINNFKEMLLDKQAILKEKPTTNTKTFVQEINNVLGEHTTAALVRGVDKAIRNAPNLFTSAIDSSRSKPSSSEPTTGNKPAPK